MNTDTELQQILRHAAEAAVKHLDDPDVDVRTIAKALEQTGRLVLLDVEQNDGES